MLLQVAQHRCAAEGSEGSLRAVIADRGGELPTRAPRPARRRTIGGQLLRYQYVHMGKKSGAEAVQRLSRRARRRPKGVEGCVACPAEGKANLHPSNSVRCHSLLGGNGCTDARNHSQHQRAPRVAL